MLERKYGMLASADGMCVEIDVDQSIRRDIVHAFQNDELLMQPDGRLVDEHGKNPLVQEAMDAANMHKGMKQTSMAHKLPLSSQNPNSPYELIQHCIFEGDDKWDAIRTFAKRPLQQLNHAINKDRWEFPELRIEGGPMPWANVDFCGGGDKANIGAMHCISGCNGPCPCHLCERPREGMCETNPEILKTDQQRSIKRINLLAHTCLGVCPGCKMKIVEVVNDPTTEMALAAPGDEPPAKSKWKKTLLKGITDSWLKLHKGVSYGRSVLLGIQPKKWAPCLLHMDLRIVGAEFEHLVINKIGSSPEAGVDQKARLVAQCKEAGVYIKEKKFDKKKNTVESAGGPKISFGGAGADAEKIKFLLPALLDTVHPKSVRDKNPAVRKQYEKSLAVAEQCISSGASSTPIWRRVNRRGRPVRLKLSSSGASSSGSGLLRTSARKGYTYTILLLTWATTSVSLVTCAPSKPRGWSMPTASARWCV